MGKEGKILGCTGLFLRTLCLKNKEVKEKGVIEKGTSYISFVDDHIDCIVTYRHGRASLLTLNILQNKVLLVRMSNKRFPVAACYLLPLAELIPGEYFKSKLLIHGIFIASDFHSRGTC